MNLFGVTFKPGDSVDITGAKVQFEGGELILSREIVIGRVTPRRAAADWDYKPETTGL